MDAMQNKLRRAAQVAGEVLAETLWPTRCVLCEKPGTVLCDSCMRNLPYIDWWRACPRCGAAYGAVQCTACDAVSLARLGRTGLPFDGCAAATAFDAATGRIVRVFKDHGEQRLADEMASCLTRYIPPAWYFDGIAFIPATVSAVRYRGFDHAQLMAEALAERIGMPTVRAFARPRTSDQRKLSRRQRFENLQGRFSADAAVCAGRRLLVVDDVLTTGATMLDAADALRAAGATCVYCMTFARV